jgi:hypothetical protein
MIFIFFYFFKILRLKNGVNLSLTNKLKFKKNKNFFIKYLSISKKKKLWKKLWNYFNSWNWG